jgi:hypothetical protein
MADLPDRFTNDLIFNEVFSENPDGLKEILSLALDKTVGGITKFNLYARSADPFIVVAEPFHRLAAAVDYRNFRFGAEFVVRDRENPISMSQLLDYWTHALEHELASKNPYLPKVTVGIFNYKLSIGRPHKPNPELISKSITESSLPGGPSFIIYNVKSSDPQFKNELLHKWLKLFAAETEEDLRLIESWNVPQINKAIKSFRNIIESRV